MIISHSHRYIFIKSAKTAGTSVETALSQFCEGDDVVTPLGDYSVNRDASGRLLHKAMNAGEFQQHDHGITIRNRLAPEVWNAYFKFSIARNPWDRMLSLFFWAHRNDPALTPRKRLYHYLGVPFDDLRPIRTQFAQFVRTGDWQNNDRFYVIDGQLCVDFVIRYENLSRDLAKVCSNVRIPVNELPHLKAGIRKTGRHYSAYYDEETKAIVGERHANDVRLLGYHFEEA